MILVTGATGSIGRHLIARLGDLGSPFKALVRDEAKGTALGCDFAVGDFDDPDSIAAAMEGADRVFLNSPGSRPVLGEQPAVRWECTVIDAARAAGVDHVVKLSIWPADPEGPLSQGVHGKVEEHLRTSGLDWTMLQPIGFMQNFLTGTGRLSDDEGNLLGPEGDARVPYIDCYDIAACAAALLTGEGRRGESYRLTGPEAITYGQIAAELSAATGRRIGFKGMNPARLTEFLSGLGLPEPVARELTGLHTDLGSGRYEATTDAVLELTGTPPRTFNQFLAADASALR